MALARLAFLKKLQQQQSTSCASLLNTSRATTALLGSSNHEDRRDTEFVRRFSSTGTDGGNENKSSNDQQQIAVTQDSGKKKSKLFPKFGKGGLWRRNKRRDELAPFDLQYIFPSGLGDALLQATHNLNRVFENLGPSGLFGQMKEKNDHYKLKYEVPGLTKEDIKIKVEDGILTIEGEHKAEEGDEDDDEHSTSYGYYNASVLLPDDAKVDEIKAQMKDGVLRITIPRTEKPKKDAKEVAIN